MSFGIGIGAFMDGFEQGVGIRQKIDARREEKANRDQLKTIETDTKAAFDKGVADGTVDEDSYDQFWMKYALPKRKMALLEQGDTAGARALQEWGESDAARRGGKLFSSALLKAQTGDAAGALQDAISAGKLDGYMKHGYDIVGQDEIKGEDGSLLGFRLRLKDDKGKELEQDVAVNDVPRMISVFLNPDAAWESQKASRAAEDKRKQELEDHEAKKKIDQKYSKGTDRAEVYRKAREERMKSDLDFADLSREEQDRAIREDLDAADAYAASQGQGEGGLEGGTGTTDSPAGIGSPVSPAGPKMIVDETTGEAIGAPSEPGQQPVAPTPTGIKSPARRLGEAVMSPGAGTVGAGMRGVDATKSEPQPAPAPTPSKTPSRQDLIQDAASHLAGGGNPEFIAQRLMNAGVAEKDWPTQLQAAYRKKPVGLAP